MRSPSQPLFAAVLLLTCRFAGAAPVDFERDVRPILANHCLECHGADKGRGGLRLTDRTTAKSAGKSGRAAIVPGKPADSEIIRRVTAADIEQRMPPAKKDPLTRDETEMLRRWIAEGAVWKGHWAWQPLHQPALPTVKNRKWVTHPIDRFVLARLEAKGIAPAPQADRYTLIKRLSYDLVGLPPTVAEVDAFVHDKSPTAYERLVDRLLASPHFGERWGRHWLDVARYADSDGYEKDRERPDAYIYRDWVISAINEDLPYDRFTIEQIAGDLLPHATVRQKIATAFNRQTLTNEEGGVDQEEFRIAAAFDRAETVGTVWLGLTVGCVRCHAHKYDPLPHEDYYRLFAFFNNGEEVKVPFAVSADRPGEMEAKLQPLEDALTQRFAELASQEQQWETAQHLLIRAYFEKKAAGVAEKDPRAQFPKDVANGLEIYAEKRTAGTRRRLFDYFTDKVLKDENVLSLRQHIAAVQSEHKAKMMDVRTLGTPLAPRKTFVFSRGDFLSPTREVKPGTPAILHTFHSRSDAPDRLDLANWLMAPENPLTPRVAVNQVWEHLFGTGLVRTANDFGVRGAPPSHPELLDWLAGQYHGELRWSRKALIRLIVTSATYRQSSRHRPELAESDPANALLARQNRFRVEAEIVRDLHLAVSGLLNPAIGGPSVFPPMPPDLAKLSYANNFTWKDSQGPDRYRRGMYTFFKRTIPHPNLTTFDAPDANVACVSRTLSDTPLQALLLLNNVTHVEAAQALARRLLEMHGSDEVCLKRLVRLCVARPARKEEMAALGDILATARTYYADKSEDAARLAGKALPKNLKAAEAAAWTVVARVMLNCDEFVTRE